MFAQYLKARELKMIFENFLTIIMFNKNINYLPKTPALSSIFNKYDRNNFLLFFLLFLKILKHVPPQNINNSIFKYLCHV